MFGHDRQDNNMEEDNTVPVSVVPASSDNTAATPPPADPQDELNLPAPTVAETSDNSDMGAPEFIETPAVAQAAAAEPAQTAEQETAVEEPAKVDMAMPAPDAELSSTPITIDSSGSLKGLDSLKQEALRELSPLIGHLDQSAEEKYETAKMVYQETNDQSLLETIYEAAKNLPDDKAKAEAILDVVNKIKASEQSL